MGSSVSEGGTGESTTGLGGLSVPLGVHIAELQKVRDRLADERDRRYAEVNIEKEKALKIKEVADRDALELARQIQTYKDEKANELREQISSERGLYLTREEYDTAHTALEEKVEALVKPLADYVTGQQGRSQGISTSFGVLLAVSTLAISVIVLIANHAIG